MEKTLDAYSAPKKAEMFILLSDKIDCKSNKFRRDKEDYILITVSIEQEDVTMINFNI